jgi:hypothetical protein
MTAKLIQNMWQRQTVPEKLSEANIYLIPKDRTDTSNPEKQRPISLTNIWLKVTDRLLQTRLKRHTESNEILSKTQAGFRALHSCTQQALTLELIIQMQTTRGKPVHACLIDIRKAFDSINRKQLFDILQAEGYPQDMANMLKSIYKSETS